MKRTPLDYVWLYVFIICENKIPYKSSFSKFMGVMPQGAKENFLRTSLQMVACKRACPGRDHF